jgi:hypothetical protein
MLEGAEAAGVYWRFVNYGSLRFLGDLFLTDADSDVSITPDKRGELKRLAAT